MSDYIKREDAENIMLGGCEESALWKLRYLPSADVVEVRHGHWEKAPSGNGWNDWWNCTCSECGKTFERFDPTNYCPNCGAKMDREEQEHE